MAADNQQREREQKLLIDEEGQPFAVRSCIQRSDGSVKWSNMNDNICRDEVSVCFSLTVFHLYSNLILGYITRHNLSL